MCHIERSTLQGVFKVRKRKLEKIFVAMNEKEAVAFSFPMKNKILDYRGFFFYDPNSMSVVKTSMSIIGSKENRSNKKPEK